MRVRRSLAALALLLPTLVACAPSIAWGDPDSVASATAIEVDAMAGSTEVIGPWYGGGRDAGEAMRLRARRDRDGSTRYLVHVRANGRAGWAEYTHASDASGREYPLTYLDRDVSCHASGCFYVEDVTAEVSRERLEAAAATGLSLRLHGEHGFDDYRLPGSYVAGVLRAVGD